MAVAGLIVLLVLLLLLRQPILTLLIAALAYVWWIWGGQPLRFMVLDAWSALNRELLLSIPLYILAGNMMSHGSMSRRIVDLMRESTCFIPGGLAVAAVLSCALFAAVSGSSTVTLVAIGSIMYPSLIAAGYPRRLVIGTLCAAATLGIIVPPSIPLIIYGVMTQVSIIDLFRAGIGPALVLTALMIGYLLVVCRHRSVRPFHAGNFVGALRRSLFSLLMPVLVLGGIYGGYFTPTEAAAVAVFYTAAVQTMVYREMRLADMYGVILRSATLIGALFPVLMLAVCLNLFLTWEKAPEYMVAAMDQALPDSALWFWLSVNALLLLVGSVIDIGSAILVLAPLLKPLATGFSIDPVHLGIAMIVNLEIGYLTPPLGLNLIVAMGVFRESFKEICLSVLPFIALLLLGLAIVVALPQLALFLI